MSNGFNSYQSALVQLCADMVPTLELRRVRSSNTSQTSMSRALTNGSKTHVRYGHSSRARDIEVVCPRCGARARAFKASERDCGVVVSDLKGTWEIPDWTVACLSCPHRSQDLTYEKLPPLFWQFTSRSAEVWAWNRDHLVFLAAYLSGEAVDGDAYAWFAPYVPGEWKRQRDSVLQEVFERLKPL